LAVYDLSQYLQRLARTSAIKLGNNLTNTAQQLKKMWDRM